MNPEIKGMNIGEPGTSTPGINMDTEGVFKTVPSDWINRTNINAIAIKHITIPTFIYHFQNLGAFLATLSINPLNLSVFNIRSIGKDISKFLESG